MKSVRITSGKYRGRKIATPGGGTHPMGERERLALFNMIAEYLPGAKVLDAYAGSGALGIEALSRGADEVIFVEKSAKAAQVIKGNLKSLGLAPEVVVCDVADYAPTEKFNVIMADPPYDAFDLLKVEHLAQFLADGGIFALSHPDDAPELLGLTLEKSRKYAGATISIYTKET